MLLDIVTDEGTSLTDSLRRILTAPQGHRTISITFGISEDDLVTNLRHPRMMVGSDGVPDLDGFPHPRLYGTFPRILSEYVRNQQVLPLEQAVRRITSLAADRFGLVNRGRIAEGAWADLVVFDPDTVADTATYDTPKREPVGIHWVVVNGQVAYDHGRHTATRSGHFLRYRDDNIPNSSG